MRAEVVRRLSAPPEGTPVRRGTATPPAALESGGIADRPAPEGGGPGWSPHAEGAARLVGPCRRGGKIGQLMPVGAARLVGPCRWGRPDRPRCLADRPASEGGGMAGRAVRGGGGMVGRAVPGGGGMAGRPVSEGGLAGRAVLAGSCWSGCAGQAVPVGLAGGTVPEGWYAGRAVFGRGGRGARPVSEGGGVGGSCRGRKGGVSGWRGPGRRRRGSPPARTGWRVGGSGI